MQAQYFYNPVTKALVYFDGYVNECIPVSADAAVAVAMQTPERASHKQTLSDVPVRKKRCSICGELGHQAKTCANRVPVAAAQTDLISKKQFTSIKTAFEHNMGAEEIASYEKIDLEIVKDIYTYSNYDQYVEAHS